MAEAERPARGPERRRDQIRPYRKGKFGAEAGRDPARRAPETKRITMRRLYDDALATMDFSLTWQHGGIRHTDALHAPRVNFWRDLLPPGLCEQLAGEPGRRSFTFDYPAGQALPPRTPSLVHRVSPEQVRRDRFPGITIEPRYGRFYPRGILRGVPGVFEENVQPFRCAALAGRRARGRPQPPSGGQTPAAARGRARGAAEVRGARREQHRLAGARRERPGHAGARRRPGHRLLRRGRLRAGRRARGRGLLRAPALRRPPRRDGHRRGRDASTAGSSRPGPMSST